MVFLISITGASEEQSGWIMLDLSDRRCRGFLTTVKVQSGSGARVQAGKLDS